jgi:hypothetical protein
MNNSDRKFLGLQRWQDPYRTNEKGLAGFAYNPIIARAAANGYDFVEFIQSEFHGSTPYFYGWPGEIDTSTRLWEFDVKSDQYNLPAAKIVALDVKNNSRNNNGMLKRGVTYAANSTNAVVFIDDTFLTSVGCPVRGSGAAAFDNWISSVNYNTLLSSFQSAVNPHTASELIMLNWEAIEQSGSVNKENFKLVDMLNWYQQQNFNAKLGAWNVAPKGFSRISYENGSTTVQNKYPTLSQKLDISYVGGYVNFPTNHGTIHHYLKEFFSCKIAVPAQICLATIWFDFEYVGNTWIPRAASPNGRNVNQSGTGAADYIWYNKPAVFNQIMFNWGVWAVAIGDGWHCWSDPVEWTDNVLDYPFKASKNGNLLVNNSGRMYARNDMKNIDWLMRGVWEVSRPEAKQIIESAGGFTFVNDIDDSFYNRKPLIAYKQHNGKTLFLNYACYANEDEIITTAVNIGGSIYNVKSYGTFTGVKVI